MNTNLLIQKCQAVHDKSDTEVFRAGANAVLSVVKAHFEEQAKSEAPKYHYFLISFLVDGVLKQSDWRHPSRNLRRSDLNQAATFVNTDVNTAVVHSIHYLGHMTQEEYLS